MDQRQQHFMPLDDYDINFEDTRGFVAKRWNDAINAVKRSLSAADCYNNLRTRAEKNSSAPVLNARDLNQIYPFPQTLTTLLATFAMDLDEYKPDCNILWGLFDLNMKLSFRGVIELFNICLRLCRIDDMNEARLSLTDILECLLQIFTDSIKHLRQNLTEAEASRAWAALQGKIAANTKEMEDVAKHLNDITSYTLANFERQVHNRITDNAPALPNQENVAFPIKSLPRDLTENFYDRQEELKRINKHVDHRRNKSALRTYTIYGRRGVGKTDIALQYAYTNPADFDAIFWVSCETRLALRQSFSDMAVDLGIPRADRNGHHEENQMEVLRWLKITKKKWLVIYDNAVRTNHAEDEAILRGYWPLGAVGAILITSRKYYNFTYDAQRKGDTVKLFTPKQSWKLLMTLLGPTWEELDRQNLLKVDEIKYAEKLLTEVGGLALAILQTANLIKNPKIGNGKIEMTYKSFMERKRDLPMRHGFQRGNIIHSLDTLWNMTFVNLTKNAHDLLSVLAPLSPDSVLVDLFLPKNQGSLDGKLEMFKQHRNHLNPETQATLSSVIVPSSALTGAMDELLHYNLVSRAGRELTTHRVVQEAMNYLSAEELQASFDSASALVYEAFPKQKSGDWMSEQYGRCQSYISHGAHLSTLFNQFNVPGSAHIRGSQKFIDLMANCGLYLMEILEATCDNLKEAEEFFRRAIAIREAAGDEAANLLANSFLCLSRVYSAIEEWDKAFKMVGLAEKLYSRNTGIDGPFMAHIHYAYGNIEYDQDRMQSAWRSYDACKTIALKNNAIHPITITACYSLGFVEFKRKNNELAIAWLDKALSIAQLRSPHRDDGTMARILWEKSQVLESDTYGRYQDEANDMRTRAELASKTLASNGEGGVVISIDDDGEPDVRETDESFDALVPGYYR